MLFCTNNDEKYVCEAINEAEKSDLRARLGCIAVISGKIIAKGHNHYRTYSKNGLIEKTCSCHAEIAVLQKCLKLNVKKKITLYIARITRNGEIACSAPCKDCIEKMRQFKIKNIVYTSNTGNPIKINFNEYSTNYRTSGYFAILHKRVNCI